jgi:hypothetical protein
MMLMCNRPTLPLQVGRKRLEEAASVRFRKFFFLPVGDMERSTHGTLGPE